MKKVDLLFLIFYLISLLSFAQTNPNRNRPFTWDNATVYFVVTDRFNNGNTANDQSYGRGKDGNGNAYTFDQVGSFYGGDLVGLNQKITDGYFDNLGINAIWITAPYEQIHGWVSGKDGAFQHYAYHGYYTLDWSEMDANMGTKADLQTLIDNAHNHGIRILMDIVMNHTGYNTAQDMTDFNFGCINTAWKGWRPGAGQTWNNIHDFITYSSSCANWSNWWSGSWVRAGLPGYPAPGGDDKTMSLAGLPDVITESTATVGLPPVLNTKWGAAKKNEENTELDAFFSRTGYPRSPRNYIIKWLTDWVRDYGIDGFRVDTEKHVEGTAWKALKDQATLALREWKTNNPTKKLDDLDFWMVGENYGYCTARSDYAINSGYDGYINFCFQGQAGNPGNYETLFSSYASTFNNDAQWNALSYISSHDTNLFNRGNLVNAGTSLLLLPGAVQIFYGDETARPAGPSGGDQPQETRSFMNWNSINQDVLAHWQKLGQFRRNHIAVGGGSHVKLKDSPYTFKRERGTDKVIVVVGASGSTTLAVSAAFADGTTLRDFYTGATGVVSGGNVTFTADAKGIILVEVAAASNNPVVNITPASGNYTSAFQVILSASGPNTPIKIYYTTDGATPTTSSTLYTAPFTVGTNTTVKALAVDAQNLQSSVVTNVYTVGTAPSFTLNFKKPSNWSASAVKIYYWNVVPSASMPVVAWPGVDATANTSAPGWYAFTFTNVTSTNLIFNDNGSTTNKTQDLTRSTTGWYKDGVWYNTNPDSNVAPVVTVTPAGPYTFTSTVTVNISATDDSGTTPTIYYTTNGSTPTTSSPNAAGNKSLTFSATTTLKFYAVDNAGLSATLQSDVYKLSTPVGGLKIHLKTTWTSPRIYYWNATPGGATITWPGASMTSEGNGWFVYTIPNATCANIIFNNNGASQTADLYRCNEGWYDNGVWYNTDPNLSTGMKIHLKTTWTTPKIYYWNATPGGATTTWPGVSMTSEGNGWFVYTIPNASCSNIIFSNNGATQTADLNRCNEGWYSNGTWYNSLPAGRTSVNTNEVQPVLTLDQYPNPVSNYSIITFSVPSTAAVNLKLYDDVGREVRVMLEEVVSEGTHAVEMDATTYRPGLYSIRLVSGNSSVVKRVLVVH
jgi:alpha-amylase